MQRQNGRGWDMELNDLLERAKAASELCINSCRPVIITLGQKAGYDRRNPAHTAALRNGALCLILVKYLIIISYFYKLWQGYSLALGR